MALTALADRAQRVRRTASATRASSRFKILSISMVDFWSRPYELGFRRSVAIAFNERPGDDYNGRSLRGVGDTSESTVNCAEEVIGCLLGGLHLISPGDEFAEGLEAPVRADGVADANR